MFTKVTVLMTPGEKELMFSYDEETSLYRNIKPKRKIIKYKIKQENSCSNLLKVNEEALVRHTGITKTKSFPAEISE